MSPLTARNYDRNKIGMYKYKKYMNFIFENIRGCELLCFVLAFYK